MGRGKGERLRGEGRISRPVGKAKVSNIKTRKLLRLLGQSGQGESHFGA